MSTKDRKNTAFKYGNWSKIYNETDIVLPALPYAKTIEERIKNNGNPVDGVVYNALSIKGIHPFKGQYSDNNGELENIKSVSSNKGVKTNTSIALNKKLRHLNRHKFLLPHCGIWVTIRKPTIDELNTYNERIKENKDEISALTAAALVGSKDGVIYDKIAIEMLMLLLVETTLEDDSKLTSFIFQDDIPLILTGIEA